MNLPGIDLRAVILLAGAMGALMSVVIWFMRRSYPRTITGLGYWAAGPALVFVSTLLFGTRGILPEFLTVIVANLLLTTGVTLLYLGSTHFYRVPANPRPWAAAIAVITAITAWFTLAQPVYNMRLLAVAGFMALVCAWHAALVVRYGGKAFAARFVQSVLIIEVLILALRAISAFSGDSADLLSASPIQTLYIAAYTVTLLMLMVGLLLMATDRLREELEHIASHDPLTGILTRRALLDVCDRELSRCRRHGRHMSLLMLDLDHFKAINDTHGHLAGDQVIIDFVSRVEKLLRKVDNFGRFGGEEFVALLPETSLDEAMVVAERIRTDLEQSGAQPGCTVSIGVATATPADQGISSIINRADEALYRAKGSGRNCVRASSED